MYVMSGVFHDDRRQQRRDTFNHPATGSVDNPSTPPRNGEIAISAPMGQHE